MAGRLNRRVWEGLAQHDADWAVVTSPERRDGAWADHLDEFYASGEEMVAHCMGLPELADVGLEHALDWGCGTARLTNALARRFARVTSVDISPTMLKLAGERLRDRGVDNVDLVLVDDLRPAGDVDVALTMLVLQHIPRVREVQAAVGSLGACLRVGGRGVIEMPSRALTLKARWQPRYRLYRALGLLGAPEPWLGRRGLRGMSMMTMPEPSFTALLERAGLKVLRTLSEPDHDFLYTQYVVERV